MKRVRSERIQNKPGKSQEAKAWTREPQALRRQDPNTSKVPQVQTSKRPSFFITSEKNLIIVPEQLGVGVLEELVHVLVHQRFYFFHNDAVHIYLAHVE